MVGVDQCLFFNASILLYRFIQGMSTTIPLICLLGLLNGKAFHEWRIVIIRLFLFVYPFWRYVTLPYTKNMAAQ